jgi:hypothetical protein
MFIAGVLSDSYNFPRSEILKREVLENVSLMPPGLVANLSVEDFGSLLRFLEELAEKNAPLKGAH